MADVALEHLSGAAGEASPPLQGRPDLARYQIAFDKVENMVVLPEGALTRRPGTRFVFPLKVESELGALLPYRYDGANAYVLVLNGGKARVVKAGGFVLSGPDPYEFVIPWAAADLANVRHAPGVPPFGNTIYATCKGFQTRTITYAGDAAWTVAAYTTFGGPSQLQNLDKTKTIIASGMTGSVTLTAEVGGTRFAAGDVGAVWRLDEADFSKTPIWVPNDTIAQTTEAIPGPTGTFGNMSNLANAFDGNVATFADRNATGYVGETFAATSVYQASVTCTVSGIAGVPVDVALYGRVGAPANETDGTLLASASGASPYVLTSSNTSALFDHLWIFAQTSGIGVFTNIQIDEIAWTRFAAGGAPVLRRWQGNVYQALNAGSTGPNPPTHTDGDVQVSPGGLIFRYRHNGRSTMQITAVADAAHATATVLDRIPDSITTTATYRWFGPAWSGVVGWPEQVAFFQRRAYFMRKNSGWASRVNAPTDHTPYDTALGAADAALSFTLTPRIGTVGIAEWLIGSGVLVAGARDGEWMLRALDNTQALTATNIDADEDGDEGSCPHIPARVGNGVIFLGRSRKKLHFVAFDRLATALAPDEISKSSRHILDGQGAWLAWQKDPHRVMWIGCLNGDLVGCTWMPKEQVIALHRHPLANGYVEAGCAIAAGDDATSEVYLIVRRVINGATRRYLERLQEFFPLTIQQNASAGWFLDCALAASGPATVVTGLAHLEAETVGVFVDGAMQADQVVTGGQITLARAAKAGTNNILVGKRIAWRIKSLPEDLHTYQGSVGSSAQQPKTARHVMVDMLNSAGGRIAVNGGTAEALMRTGAHVPGTPIALFTGRRRASTLGPEKDTLVWEITGDDPLPFTLRSVRLKADIEED